MSETLELSPVEDGLGAEFWTQPESALDTPFAFLYSQALAELRKEVRERDGGILDYLVVERLAFSYAVLRQREAAQDDEALTDRTRREMNKDFLDFTLTVKKIWNSEDRHDESDKLIKRIDKAVFEAVKVLPESQRKVAQLALADQFEALGIG